MVKRSKIIDHTLLKADATQAQVEQLCQEAVSLEMGAVCVNARWVKLCVQLLADTDVQVCTVVGFPLGATTSEVKAYEAHQAVVNGAHEVDMVIDLGAVKDGDWDYVRSDICAVVEASKGALVKVILETCLLNDEQIVQACRVAIDAGADFVKTSTGFAAQGASVHAVRLMRATVGPDYGVKASGGIRTYEDYNNMVEAGASRIGASAGKVLLGD